MATRSTIVKLGKDGIIKAVYCHSDGYLEHNGKVLSKLIEYGNYIVYPGLGKLVEYKGAYIRVQKT